MFEKVKEAVEIGKQGKTFADLADALTATKEQPTPKAERIEELSKIDINLIRAANDQVALLKIVFDVVLDQQDKINELIQAYNRKEAEE